VSPELGPSDETQQVVSVSPFRRKRKRTSRPARLSAKAKCCGDGSCCSTRGQGNAYASSAEQQQQSSGVLPGWRSALYGHSPVARWWDFLH